MSETRRKSEKERCDKKREREKEGREGGNNSRHTNKTDIWEQDPTRINPFILHSNVASTVTTETFTGLLSKDDSFPSNH